MRVPFLVTTARNRVHIYLALQLPHVLRVVSRLRSNVYYVPPLPRAARAVLGFPVLVRVTLDGVELAHCQQAVDWRRPVLMAARMLTRGHTVTRAHPARIGTWKYQTVP